MYAYHILKTYIKTDDKFTNLAKSYFDLIHKAETLRDDLTVVFVSHLENTGTEMDPIYRLFTTGK